VNHTRLLLLQPPFYWLKKNIIIHCFGVEQKRKATKKGSQQQQIS